MVLVMDELLGVNDNIVNVGDLQKWSQLPPLYQQTIYNEENEDDLTESPFPYNPTLNDKVVLW